MPFHQAVRRISKIAPLFLGFIAIACAPAKPHSETAIAKTHSFGSPYYARAMEPFAIAGEKDEQLALDFLAALEKEGDTNFARKLSDLSPEERSALRLFVTPRMLAWDASTQSSDKYPKTTAEIAHAYKRKDWPSVIASRRAFDDPDFECDLWPE